jgi:hypothetical protein
MVGSRSCSLVAVVERHTRVAQPVGMLMIEGQAAAGMADSPSAEAVEVVGQSGEQSGRSASCFDFQEG